MNPSRDLRNRAMGGESFKDITFLDLGLEIGNRECVSQICVFIPAAIKESDLSDLSPVIKNQRTLKAVFNDIVEISGTGDDYFIVSKTGRQEDWKRRVWRIGAEDFMLEDLSDVDHGGVILTLKEAVFDRMRKTPEGIKEYLRFRIALNADTVRFCVSEMKSSLMGGGAIEPHYEAIEFRMNERRSYPEDIEKRSAIGVPLIKSVNYFLITNTSRQITTQHTNFKRVRQLESKLWADYICGSVRRHGEVSSAVNARYIDEKKLGNELLSIYQWKEGKEHGVEDFNAYATFSSGRVSIWKYIALAFVVSLISGIIGSLIVNYFSAPHLEMVRPGVAVDDSSGP